MAVEAFGDDPTFAELVEAIQREIEANAPDAALHRPHTYTMKKFANLLERAGIAVGHNDALHARASRYVNNLRQTGQIGEYWPQIAKPAVQVRYIFKKVRNKQSLDYTKTILVVKMARRHRSWELRKQILKELLARLILKNRTDHRRPR